MAKKKAKAPVKKTAPAPCGEVRRMATLAAIALRAGVKRDLAMATALEEAVKARMSCPGMCAMLEADLLNAIITVTTKQLYCLGAGCENCPDPCVILSC